MDKISFLPSVALLIIILLFLAQLVSIDFLAGSLVIHLCVSISGILRK